MKYDKGQYIEKTEEEMTTKYEEMKKSMLDLGLFPFSRTEKNNSLFETWLSMPVYNSPLDGNVLKKYYEKNGEGHLAECLNKLMIIKAMEELNDLGCVRRFDYYLNFIQKESDIFTAMDVSAQIDPKYQEGTEFIKLLEDIGWTEEAEILKMKCAFSKEESKIYREELYQKYDRENDFAFEEVATDLHKRILKLKELI